MPCVSAEQTRRCRGFSASFHPSVCDFFFFFFFFPELSFGQILTSAIFMSAKLRLGLVQSCCGNLAFKPLRRTMVFICWINLWKMCRQCVCLCVRVCVHVCVCVHVSVCVYLFHLDSSTEFCLYLPRRHSTPETKLHSGKTGKLKAKLVLPVKCYWSPSILPCGVIKSTPLAPCTALPAVLPEWRPWEAVLRIFALDIIGVRKR